jgi:S1-C subfamily serine protease
MRGGSLEFSIGGDSLLLGGDIVVTVNGAPATDPDKFEGIMRSLKVGDRLKLKVYRDEKYLELAYVLPERPLLPGDLPASRSFLPNGSTVQP